MTDATKPTTESDIPIVRLVEENRWLKSLFVCDDCGNHPTVTSGGFMVAVLCPGCYQSRREHALVGGKDVFDQVLCPGCYQSRREKDVMQIKAAEAAPDGPRWHYPQPISKGWWVASAGRRSLFLFLGDADVPDGWYFGPLPSVPTKLPDEQRPAWRDKPPHPGRYIAEIDRATTTIVEYTTENLPGSDNVTGPWRYFGPIPEDAQLL